MPAIMYNPLTTLVALAVAGILLGIWAATGRQHTPLRVMGGIAFVFAMIAFGTGRFW